MRRSVAPLVVAMCLGICTAAAQSNPPPADEGPPPEDAPNHQARVPLPTGPYMKSCKDPILRDGVLYATCLQPDKTQRQAKLTLPCAGKIENKAGVLVCAK